MTPARKEAITVALALVPTLLPRNRLFAFYTNSEAKSARRRAAVLRGLASQLLDGAEDVRLQARGDSFVLAYRVASVHASRRALLSRAEAACVAHLVERGGSSISGAPDRSVLEAALANLDEGRTISELEASGE
ncbi:MAG: hypothetical protein ACRELY_18510 [Polyangiaceae bacterium]